MEESIMFMFFGLGYAAIVATTVWLLSHLGRSRGVRVRWRQRPGRTRSQPMPLHNRINELERAADWWRRCN